MLRRLTITCFTAIFAALLAIAVAGCSRSPAVYVVPDHKDLGVINAPGTATADFEIVNGLDRPLNITHIFPSCTCTNVSLQTNPIPPGASANL